MKFHPDDIADFKEVFAYFDRSKKSVITSKNLATTLRSLSPVPTEKTIQKAIKEHSDTKTGTLDFSKFLTAIHDAIEVTKKSRSRKITERKEVGNCNFVPGASLRSQKKDGYSLAKIGVLCANQTTDVNLSQ